MKATLWARTRMFVGRHGAKIALALVVAAAAGAVAGVRWEAEERRQADVSEASERADAISAAAEERRAQICEEAANLRLLVSELIDVAVADNGPSVNLLDVPSFGGLPPSVQTFLQDYVAAVAAGESAPDLAERLREFQRTRLGALPAFCDQ